MKIKLVDGGKMPTLGTVGSVAYDLYAIEHCCVVAQGRLRVRTGVHLEIPRGQKGIIAHRSGMNSKDGILAYGTIDSDYRGELIVTLFNTERFRDFYIQKGDRIAQISFVDVNYSNWELVDDFGPTERGEGGHGSTGV